MQMPKKKYFSVAILLVVALLMTFTLAACGDKGAQVGNSNAKNSIDYSQAHEGNVVSHAWQFTEGKQQEGSVSDYQDLEFYTIGDDKKTLYVKFGEYPQTGVVGGENKEKEEENKIISALNGLIGETRPEKGNRGKWTDYGYYISGSTSEYMWYIDLEYNGARYRGVYFTSYRPWYTTISGAGNTYQDDNGYNTNTVYWFKWEPIEWRVLEKTDSEVFLMSNVILDSRQYYYATSTRKIDKQPEGTNSADENSNTDKNPPIYPNNYKESNIRAWLNGTFLSQAFGKSEQAIIKETLVDNSAETTNSGVNNYACENTNDKVFLLSYQDVINAKYGFSGSGSSANEARQLKATGYAQSQGAPKDGNGNGWWWLRSPYNNINSYALYVHCDGYAGDYACVTHTDHGVVPAIKIAL